MDSHSPVHRPGRQNSASTQRPSLWLDREPIQTDADLESTYDDLVVGAGLTGLTTALLLARAGRKVAVLEAREIGAVATGNTTGKLSLLQGTKLSTMLARQSEKVAAAYLEANREGQAWLLRFCEEHAVPFQRPRRRHLCSGRGARSEVGSGRSTRRPSRSGCRCAGSSACRSRSRTRVGRCSLTRRSSTRWMSWRR